MQALLPGPVDPDAVRAVAEANWMQLLGPPLAESDPLEGPTNPQGRP